MDELSDIHFDLFQFQGYLGQGAFGVVLKALNLQTNQIVAIKVIKKKQISQCAQLLQEATILRELSHPNIVKFFGVYETETRILIEMELIEGGSLCSIQKCTEEQAKYIIHSILNALSYMHNNNIVHRDLKPENILINSDLSTVKVSDFGLSTSYCSLMTKQCGTLIYMAPEQLNNKLYNKSIDIWAVGVIMYQLLCGQHPYYEKGCDIAQRQLRMHQLCRPHLNDIQFSLFRRLTELDPSKRYSATQAILHPWLNNGSEEPLTMEEQFLQWKQSLKLQNLILSLMLLGQIGYKQQLYNRELCNTISMQHTQTKKRDFTINYDQLFADYQQSLTDAQKTRVSTKAITLDLNTMTDTTKVSASTLVLSNKLLTGIKQPIRCLQSLNQTPIVAEDIEQEIMMMKISQQCAVNQNYPERMLVLKQPMSVQPNFQELSSTSDQYHLEQLCQQSTTTNTTTPSPNKSPQRKKRVKRTNIREIVNADIVSNNILQINEIKQPATMPPINKNRESPTNTNKFKIQLKPINHPVLMVNSQHVGNAPSYRPRLQRQPIDKQLFAPPVLDLSNLALDCLSPKIRHTRTKSLHNNQRRLYANEFQPSRILGGSVRKNCESFYVQ